MKGQNIANPALFNVACESDYILPGDTLFMRGGTYYGDFTFKPSGTALNPITIKPYNNEKPVIDGQLIIEGSNIIIEDIEIKYSGFTTRTSAQSGSVPTDIPLKTFTISGDNVECRRIIMHDLTTVYTSTTASKTKYSGCISYNIGWIGSDRSHGHGYYLKNNDASLRKELKNCISFNSFRQALNAFREGTTQCNFIDLIQNIFINAAGPANLPAPNQWYYMEAGGASEFPVTDHNWRKNMLYNTIAVLGNGSAVDIGIIEDNNFSKGFIENPANTNITKSGNIVGPQTGIVQYCYQDEYINTRGYLTIYNWDLSNTVIANLSNIAGLSVGNTVRLRSVENYLNDYQDLVLDGSKQVTVNMQASVHTVAQAIGHSYVTPTNFPEFGCFIVEKI